MKVKLRCTNCQSLARLSPVFSAPRFCVPDLVRAFSHRHSVSPWSLFAQLGGRADNAPFLRIHSLEKQYPYRPTLDRTLTTPY